MPMVLVFVLKWVKSVLRCALYIFHLSDNNRLFTGNKVILLDTILHLRQALHRPYLILGLHYFEASSLGQASTTTTTTTTRKLRKLVQTLAEGLVLWLWEETHVPKIVGSNLVNVYLLDGHISRIFAVKIGMMFV